MLKSYSRFVERKQEVCSQWLYSPLSCAWANVQVFRSSIQHHYECAEISKFTTTKHLQDYRNEVNRPWVIFMTSNSFLIINDAGKFLNFMLTPGNVDFRIITFEPI